MPENITKNQELLNRLAQDGKIEAEKIPEYLERVQKEKKKLDDILVKERVVDPERLAQLKAEIFGLEYMNLGEVEIEEGALNVISSEVAENYRIICFAKEGDKIKIGLTDPENFKAMEAVDFLAKRNNYHVEYYVISEKSFLQSFQKYQSLSQELDTALKTRAEEEEELVTVSEKEQIELEEVTKSAPVAKIVSVIIRHAVEGGASDIHIEPVASESRVRYRIDGVLHTSLVLPKSVHAAIVARIKVMANMKLDETRVPQDGRIRMDINEKIIDFRVSTLPLIGAEKVVMRILDTTKGAPKLEELGFQGRQLEAIKSAIEKTEGIVLVTGPTGSGKSTTLFSIIDIINKESINIATLENPVEYQMRGVNQSQVKPEIGYTFASGLRSFLRQDPDVIMVGEIRDKETAELAIHAALTGHLVFSTLHTTNAPGAITRLVDMGVEAFLLGSTLVATVAQRLARRLCEHCKEEAKLPDKHLSEVRQDVNDIGLEYVKKMVPDFDENNMKFYKSKGCSRCGNSGYSGRLSVCEVLEMNDQLKEKIINGAKHIGLKEIRETQVYLTVKQDGVLKSLQGLTSYEEVLRVMRD